MCRFCVQTPCNTLRAQGQLFNEETGVPSRDADAGLYWLGRMLVAGEEPLYIARRLIRLASEDIGLADSSALPLVWLFCVLNNDSVFALAITVNLSELTLSLSLSRVSVSRPWLLIKLVRPLVCQSAM
jgi:hypothetical protein